jgi:hypothetical protein
MEAFDQEAQQFGPLFDLEVWGSILGMFDLNNLSIKAPPAPRFPLGWCLLLPAERPRFSLVSQVWSPCNRYFEFIGSLEEPELSEVRMA